MHEERHVRGQVFRLDVVIVVRIERKLACTRHVGVTGRLIIWYP